MSKFQRPEPTPLREVLHRYGTEFSGSPYRERTSEPEVSEHAPLAGSGDRPDVAAHGPGKGTTNEGEAMKNGAWLPYLEKLGIESRNAQRWMELAGYVESKNDTRSDVSHLPTPTLADAGIDKRPRKRDAAPNFPSFATVSVMFGRSLLVISVGWAK